VGCQPHTCLPSKHLKLQVSHLISPAVHMCKEWITRHNMMLHRFPKAGRNKPPDHEVVYNAYDQHVHWLMHRGMARGFHHSPSCHFRAQPSGA
jgi:hypothetical protein